MNYRPNSPIKAVFVSIATTALNPAPAFLPEDAKGLYEVWHLRPGVLVLVTGRIELSNLQLWVSPENLPLSDLCNLDWCEPRKRRGIPAAWMSFKPSTLNYSVSQKVTSQVWLPFLSQSSGALSKASTFNPFPKGVLGLSRAFRSGAFPIRCCSAVYT